MFASRVSAWATVIALLASRSVAKTPVSASVFSNIIHYSQFAAAAYGDTCASPPFGSSVVTYFNDAATDTQATLFRDDSAKQVIIAFRGTSTPYDLDTDLNFGFAKLNATGTKCANCQVHTGFQTAYNAISSQVISSINSQLSSHAGYALIVTGHSLGGGIAGIASASLAAAGKKVTAYTYGEPRNGDQTFATYVNSLVPPARYFRVTHANDGVPQIPPTVLGYAHHGTEYWLSQTATSTAQNTYQCPGQQATDCNTSTNYGSDPINAAHLFYGNALIANSLHIAACGATSP